MEKMLKIFSFHFIYLLCVHHGLVSWAAVCSCSLSHSILFFCSVIITPSISVLSILSVSLALFHSTLVFVNFLKYVFLFRINSAHSCLLQSFSILRKRIPFSAFVQCQHTHTHTIFFVNRVLEWEIWDVHICINTKNAVCASQPKYTHTHIYLYILLNMCLDAFKCFISIQNTV